MATGVVKWFNDSKGFGFIAPDAGGQDLFAHFADIQSTGYRSLFENQKVEFDVKDGPKGPQACNIKPGPEPEGARRRGPRPEGGAPRGDRPPRREGGFGGGRGNGGGSYNG